MPVRDSLKKMFRFPSLTLRQKLVVVCLLFALPIGYLLYFLVGLLNSDLAWANKGQMVGQYLRACQTLLDHASQHRQALHRKLSNDKASPDLLGGQAAAVEADLKALEQLDGVAPLQFVQGERGLRDRLSAVRKRWQRINNRTPGTTPADSDAWHQELNEEVLALMSQALEDASVQVSSAAEARVQELLAKKAIIFGGVSLAVALTLVLVFVIVRNLTSQVNAFTSLFQEIGKGNYQARTPVYNKEDEVGQMAVSLNKMLDNITALLQSREERDRIQASITRLLDEVSGVAEGDLTHEAEVTADVTGAIADSFNFMIEQLRRIIRNVQNATLEVNLAANQIHRAAEQLAQGSEDQAREISVTTGAVRKVTASIRQVAENADASARVAQQSLASAREGGRAVHDTIRGMNRIREQVQETAKRIKRLGESTQQIGEIVQLIDDIADRTSILALNASIQAAMAGEAGRGFAVVAEEVERLSERSANATKKIAALVKTIQSETNEAVTAMEGNTREVVEGSRLANQAGQALGQIETVSTQLAELILAITETARQQAQASDNIAQSMHDISEVTRHTAVGTRKGAVSVTQLAALADDLRDSVSAFRLPAEADGQRLPNRPEAPVLRRLPVNGQAEKETLRLAEVR
jgi:methyl-accepting chemotaxis protein